MMDDRLSHEIGRSSGTMMAFVLGTAVGAGIALLLAPASGTETRRRLRETSRRWGTNVKEGVEHARDRFGGLKEDARNAVNAGREAFDRERSEPVSPEYP